MVKYSVFIFQNQIKKFIMIKSEIKEKLFADFIARNPQTGKSKNLRISAWGCCLNIDFLRKNNLKFVSEREYICEDIYFFTEMFDVLESALIL